jgi:hypothetical protein
VPEPALRLIISTAGSAKAALSAAPAERGKPGVVAPADESLHATPPGHERNTVRQEVPIVEAGGRINSDRPSRALGVGAVTGHKTVCTSVRNSITDP